MPSRQSPGSVYALPQSPQLFKQLLMVAGIERYYQIARCFRDEDLRADRQPEFTQLDVEASFIDEEDVYALVEELMAALWHELLGVELAVPFPRIVHAEALRRYGSDRPTCGSAWSSPTAARGWPPPGSGLRRCARQRRFGARPAPAGRRRADPP